MAYEDVADRLGVSRTNEVSSAATTLEGYKIVEKEKHDDGTYVDLNVDGLNEIREAAARRRKTSELMETLWRSQTTMRRTRPWIASRPPRGSAGAPNGGVGEVAIGVAAPSWGITLGSRCRPERPHLRTYADRGAGSN